MALNIPLPNASPGGFSGGMNQANNFLKQLLENKYYAPNMESQIGYRNALTQGQNISNQYTPEKMKLENFIQKIKSQFLPQETQSKINYQNALTNNYNTMTPLQAAQLKISNQWSPQLNQSQIDTNKALSQYRMMGGGRMGVDQQAIQGLKQQIMQDNPTLPLNKINEIAGVALEGGNNLSDGTPLPKLSGIVQSMITDINKKHSTASIQNQAANMSVLSKDIDDIDISPVARFSGLSGKLDVAKYTADMARGNPVPEEFRDYLAFKRIAAPFAMDSLRKGFGTSVVPGYVYATLGKASDPSSSFWTDPKQVIKEWNTTKDWIRKNAERYKIKADKGATAELPFLKEEFSKMSDEELRKIAGY